MWPTAAKRRGWQGRFEDGTTTSRGGENHLELRRACLGLCALDCLREGAAAARSQTK